MAKKDSVNRSYAVEKEAREIMDDRHFRILDIKKIENYKKNRRIRKY